MLWVLVLLPLFVIFYLIQQGRRRRIAAQYSGFGVAGQNDSKGAGLRRHLPPLLFLAALTILILASARPQTVVSLPTQDGIIMLAFDVSGSMAADDLKPTRMEAAKAAARDFIDKQPSTVQIGIVAFSDGGLSVRPPTNDKDALYTSMDQLAPQRGTSLGSGILVSLNAIAVSRAGDTTHFYSNLTPAPTAAPTPVPQGAYIPAVIILLTDGENNENPNPLAAAQAAANQGVRIYTVGIGSAAGTTLHVNGFTVHTQLDEALLKQISQMTGGSYYNAESAQDLKNIYDDLDPQLTIKPQKMEVTSLFAGAGIIVLMLGGLYSLLWFGRLI